MVVLLTLAAGEHPLPVSGQELARRDPAAEQHGGEGAIPGDYLWSPFFDLFLLHEAVDLKIECMLVPVARGGGPSGAVEEDKAYIVGRPLFKVPPSSPCRAKAMRC